MDTPDARDRITRLLAQAFPGVEFTVRPDPRRSHSHVIEWEAREGYPDERAVLAVIDNVVTVDAQIATPN